jgi:hypothetical protein
MLEFRYQRRIQHGKGWRFRRPIMEEVGKIQGKVRSQAGILYCKTNLSKTSRRSKRETTFVIHHFFFFFVRFDRRIVGDHRVVENKQFVLWFALAIGHCKATGNETGRRPG